MFYYLLSHSLTETLQQIGGSIAGLMHGITLKRLGHNLHVLEQNPTSTRADQGAGITAGPHAEAFFKHHDLSGEPWSVPCPGFQLLDVNAKVKRFVKRPMQMSSWGMLYYRLRASYDGYRSKFCPDPPSGQDGDGEAVFDAGKKVTSVSYADSVVTVGYKDNNNGKDLTIQGDLVIAADGVSSTVRQMMLPGVQRVYSGYVAWRGCILESEVSEETRKVFDPQFSAFTYPGGYILWLVKSWSQHTRGNPADTVQLYHPWK